MLLTNIVQSLLLFYSTHFSQFSCKTLRSEPPSVFWTLICILSDYPLHARIAIFERPNQILITMIQPRIQQTALSIAIRYGDHTAPAVRRDIVWYASILGPTTRDHSNIRLWHNIERFTPKYKKKRHKWSDENSFYQRFNQTNSHTGRQQDVRTDAVNRPSDFG